LSFRILCHCHVERSETSLRFLSRKKRGIEMTMFIFFIHSKSFITVMSNPRRGETSFICFKISPLPQKARDRNDNLFSFSILKRSGNPALAGLLTPYSLLLYSLFFTHQLFHHLVCLP